MSSFPFDDFFNHVLASHVADGFSPEMLRSRLVRMGLKNILEEQYIQRFGFPCKYNSPLDEAILVTYYFLTMNRRLENSAIKMYAIHVPTKEEENSLSFWRSAKAGLYLDLHAMVLNNNKKYEISNSISRLFVFRDSAQLAHLDVSGISVILEQQSIGIETGFVMLSEQDSSDSPLFRGALLIELEHPQRPRWALLLDRLQGPQPYENEMVCKWFDGGIDNTEIMTCLGATKSKRDGDFVDLFRFKSKRARQKTGKECYEFEREPGGFRDLLLANAVKAFEGLPEQKALEADYEEYLEIKRVPKKLVEFCETLNKIRNDSRTVIAIDATSVKNTLRVHDTDPNYRHWIRNTVQLAIENVQASLERIYILDLSRTKDEYDVFRREIDLYYDYLENTIYSLAKIWPTEEMLNEEDRSNTVPRENQTAFAADITVYVTSIQAIQSFCGDRRLAMDKKKEILEKLKQVFVYNSGSVDIGTTAKKPENDPRLITKMLKEDLPRLDFLCTEGLIYNYKDYRGEPSQTRYMADRFETDAISREQEDSYHYLHDLLKRLSEPVVEKNSSRMLLPDVDTLKRALDKKKDEWFANSQKENSQKKDDAGPEALPSEPGAATEPSSIASFSETSEDEAHAKIIISGLRGSKPRKRK